MRSRPKGFYWRQLPQNHFQYRFCISTNPGNIVWTSPMVQGLVLRKAQCAASAKIEDKQEVLNMPFSGKVLKFINPVETGNQELFLFEKCEHIPIKGISNIEVCQICGDQLLSYEDKEQISYTKRQFKQIKNLDAPIEWEVALNQQFSSGKILGICGEDEIALDFIGRVVFISDSKDRDGIILKVRKTICLHEQVKDNICLLCGCYIEVQRTSITVQGNGTISTGRLLQQLELQFANKLKHHQKLLLILDLDNTIVHCMENYMNDEVDFQISDCLVLYAHPLRLLIKVRPFMREFLQKILPKFDIFIYTKGTRQYAEKICEHLRKVYADLLQAPEYNQYFTRERIVSRNQDSSLTQKSLSNILNGHDGMILILDDRKDVWGQRRKNVINTKYYRHYQKQSNKISQLPFKDYYLYYTRYFLLSIHESFFHMQQEKQDVRLVIKTLQKQRLAGIKAFFLQENLKSNSFYVRAINMGIIDVVDWVKSAPSILIYSPSFAHKDQSKLQSMGIPLIHQLWIQYCYFQNYKFSQKDFDVSKGDYLTGQSTQERAEFEKNLFQSHKLQ